MANTRIRKTLAAAFPLREVKQPHASVLTAPDVYAWTSLPVRPNSSDGAGSATVTQVLQVTLKETSTAVTEANKQLSALLPVQQQNLDNISQNTQALVNNTASKSSGGSSVLSTAGNIAGSIFGGGSLLSPIIRGLVSLFGGGPTPQPAFTAFTMPAPIHLDTTFNSPLPGGVQQTIPQTAASVSPAASSDQGSDRGTAPTPAIQINVNAIDSKSFLDHSDQIAQAVRQALLNSHPLADVIAEI
jgi:hypothetical protein